MRKTILAAAAGLAAMAGAAYAQDEAATPEAAAPEPTAQVGDCALFGETPEMPNPKSATGEDRSATIQSIKDYQAKLNEYRTCLTMIYDNEELEVEARQAALKEYNRTVEVETAMVEDWQKFSKKYDKANK